MKTKRPKVMTVTIVPTRTLVAVEVEGKTHALPEGTTDVDVFGVVRPFVSFPDYSVGYAGPKERTTVLIDRIKQGEPIGASTQRVEAKIKSFNSAAAR